MKSFARTLVLVALLPLVGGGCFRIGPRIVKAPQPARVAESPQAALTEESKTLAYLGLNGGAASVTRGDKTVGGEDGLELVEGDEILVTSGSVNLVYPDTGMSELENGTRVVLLLDDGKDGGGVFAQVRLEAGKIWTRFEKLFGPDDHFSVAANGVVATVRGTAFGVSAVNGDVDVQVADSEVEVTTEQAEAASTTTAPSVPVIALAAGQGIRISARALARVDATNIRTLVRKLSESERAAAGFRFGLRRIAAERLKKPVRPIRLPIRSAIPTRYEERARILRARAMLERIFPRFSAPLRVPLDIELTPTTTPSVKGPTELLP